MGKNGRRSRDLLSHRVRDNAIHPRTLIFTSLQKHAASKGDIQQRTHGKSASTAFTIPGVITQTLLKPPIPAANLQMLAYTPADDFAPTHA
jgi:hypothetical protein